MKITVKSINQFFLASATMTIILNGVESAWLGNGEQVTLDAPEGKNRILIKSSLREKDITLEASQDVTITVKWNRISGKIETLVAGPDVKLISE